ncbi:Peptidase S1 domain-containing protein [Caenorhabditis elegans]|uniref:Peptidase S1 domain-containing protein n=1 Tax=Caenorhabditis elegans TaxID=6239 RepID=O01771_CAEEL|nr:Peptidase S1 domain-containing protein [Caenorhabditis elegans]CCD64905.2 Peptidase S1 domain-containing protein [Caenorhabditis elegans]|eukprot:NP_491910.2 TRYpsin-like protease [Caenorhabditis elegans]
MRWCSVILIVLTVQLVNCDLLTLQENEQRLKSCGKPLQSKVYNGRDASQSEAPWSVFTYLYSKDEQSATTCTGTIVSPRHILIATHCFAGQNRDGSWNLIEDTFDRSNCKDDDYVITNQEFLKRVEFLSNKKGISRYPEKITLVHACTKRTANRTKKIPPQYYTDDFAIVHLYEELTFSSNVQSVCVADDETQPNDKLSLEYFGFGLNPPSDINQNGVDNTGQLRYEKIEVFRSHPMEIYFFQARDITDKTVACVGDSGGGAIADVKGKKTIIGVLSQTSCQKRRGGNETMELYSSVGFYKNQICKYTGICDKADSYNKYHKGYIRTQKPVRTTEAPREANARDLKPGSKGGKDKPNGVMGKFLNLIIIPVIFSAIINFL